jgi:hypothetical protein
VKSLGTPAKSFWKRFGLSAILSAMISMKYLRTKKSETKILLPAFEVLKNHAQFLLHPDLKQSKTDTS